MFFKPLLVKLLVLVIGIFYLSARLEVQPQQTGENMDKETHVGSKLDVKLSPPVVAEPPLPLPVEWVPPLVLGLLSVVYWLRRHRARPEHPPPNLPLYNRLFLRHSVFRL